MAAKRLKRVAEIRRLSGIAWDAIERERAHRGRLYKRGRRLARSGRAVGLMSMAGLVALALSRRRRDRDAEAGKADVGRHPDIAGRAGARKRKHHDSRILELARLVVTTSRLWESAAARR